MKSFYRNALHCVLFPFRYLPEGNFKQALRLKTVAFQNSVPLYLVIDRGDTAIQVGTPNVRTMRRYSSLVGQNGTVVVIEAEPSNANRLREALNSMPHDNVTIVQKGAWSSPGTMVLEKSDDFIGDHKLKIDDIYVDNEYRSPLSTSIEIEVDLSLIHI